MKSKQKIFFLKMTGKSKEQSKINTCVVDALNAIPRMEQMPRPAATASATSKTPAIPIPLCDWITLFHRRSVIHA